MKDFLSVLKRAIHGKKSEIFPADSDPEKLAQIAKLHKVLPHIVQTSVNVRSFLPELIGYLWLLKFVIKLTNLKNRLKKLFRCVSI